MAIEFVVENAGCVSCGRVIRDAVSAVGQVEVVAIDEDADVASVRLEPSGTVSLEDVDRILEEASAGAGHAYRIRPRSWRALPGQ
jgi:hypothetical protein